MNLFDFLMKFVDLGVLLSGFELLNSLRKKAKVDKLTLINFIGLFLCVILYYFMRDFVK